MGVETSKYYPHYNSKDAKTKDDPLKNYIIRSLEKRDKLYEQSSSNVHKVDTKAAQLIGKGGHGCAFYPYYQNDSKIPKILFITGPNSIHARLVASQLILKSWKWKTINVNDFYVLSTPNDIVYDYSKYYTKQCWDWADPDKHKTHLGLLMDYGGDDLEYCLEYNKFSRLQAAVVLYRFVALVVLTFEMGLYYRDPRLSNVVVSSNIEDKSLTEIVKVRFIDLDFGDASKDKQPHFKHFNEFKVWAEKFDIDTGKVKTLVPIIQSDNLIHVLAWLKDYLIKHRQSKQLIQNIAITRL